MGMLREMIGEYCEKNNLAWGVSSALPFRELREELSKCEEVLRGFVHGDLEMRLDPKKTMEDAKSIIVIAKPYNRKITFKQDGKIRCKIAMGAFGEDYHIYMRGHLTELADILFKEKQENSFMCFSDTGPLDDRALAKRAGLGNYGKNHMLITPKYGSAVNIGYIITDLELPCDNAFERDLCRGCTKCIEACPSGALSEGGYEVQKCISYISQKKGELTSREKDILGNTLYGCDICMRACIYNDKFFGEVSDIDEMYPEAEYILSLSNKGFKKRYEKTGICWRGLGVMKRNAKNALERGMRY